MRYQPIENHGIVGNMHSAAFNLDRALAGRAD
jgi:hypothetical protein